VAPGARSSRIGNRSAPPSATAAGASIRTLGGGPSSSSIVPVAALSPIVAPCGSDSVTVNVSAGSSSRSWPVATANTRSRSPSGIVTSALVPPKSAPVAVPSAVVAVTTTSVAAGASRLTANPRTEPSMAESSAIDTSAACAGDAPTAASPATARMQRRELIAGRVAPETRAPRASRQAQSAPNWLVPRYQRWTSANAGLGVPS
jgi:hypothetical protein